MVNTGNRLRLTLGTFNLVKGFSMIVVFIGHMHGSVIWKNSLPLTFIFAVTYILRNAVIPLFMLVSGFNFREAPFGKLLKKTFSELIVPYLLIAVVCAVVRPIVAYIQFGSLHDAIYETKRILIAFLFGIPKSGKIIFDTKIRWIAASWYLLALFWALNITNLVLKIKNVFSQIVILILCAIFGYYLFVVGFNYYCLAHGLMAAGYCYIGYQIKRRKLLERMYNNIWIYLILVPISFAQAKWGYYDLCYGDFNSVALDCIGAGCFGLLLMLLGVYFDSSSRKCLDWIKQIGSYTYWILFVHSVEMLCFPWELLTKVHPDHPIFVLICEIIVRILIVISCCCIMKKYARIKYGRRREQIGRTRIS